MKAVKMKLNMDVVNCVLLVVILVLVIYCVVKQNEGFQQSGVDPSTLNRGTGQRMGGHGQRMSGGGGDIYSVSGAMKDSVVTHNKRRNNITYGKGIGISEWAKKRNFEKLQSGKNQMRDALERVGMQGIAGSGKGMKDNR